MLFFIAISIIDFFLSQNVIKIPIIETKVAITYGNELTLNFYPDLNVTGTYLDTYLFKNKKYQLLETKLLYFSDYKKNCTVIIESIEEKSSHLIIDDFLYYYSPNNYSVFPRLAFAHLVDHDSSLVYQSFKHGNISRLEFAINRNKNKNGYLYLGGFIDHEHKYQKGFCHAISNKIIWACNLTAIYFEEYEYITNEYAYFDYRMNNLQFPHKFFVFIEEKMKEKNKENSTINEYDLTFKVENFLYTIKNAIKKNLNSKYTFEFDLSRFGLILSHPFFSSFILSFDYQNDIINIYGLGSIKEIKPSKPNHIIKLININSIILLLNSLFILFQHYKPK